MINLSERAEGGGPERSNFGNKKHVRLKVNGLHQSTVL